jgi:hypothetical protein
VKVLIPGLVKVRIEPNGDKKYTELFLGKAGPDALSLATVGPNPPIAPGNASQDEELEFPT